jgi:restriction system protein
MPEDIGTDRKFEYFRTALELVRDAGEDGIAPKDLFPKAVVKLKPSGIELQPYKAQPGSPRFQTIIRFMTIRAVKAGWMIKSSGRWYITPDGIAALDQFASANEFGRASMRAYASWRQSAADSADVHPAAATDDVGPTTSESDINATELERAHENATEGIIAHLRAMTEFEFQDMVAALLSVLGYYVGWIAPPGPDHGVDIIAYPDAIGALKPRIKVQVKHTDTAVSRPMLQAFFGVLGHEEIGIYVSLAGFTKDARIEARTHSTFRVTLVDSDDLIALWIANYGKMTEDQKRFMRVEPVYFLSSST